jgi:hypothetical protein
MTEYFTPVTGLAGGAMIGKCQIVESEIPLIDTFRVR